MIDESNQMPDERDEPGTDPAEPLEAAAGDQSSAMSMPVEEPADQEPAAHAMPDQTDEGAHGASVGGNGVPKSGEPQGSDSPEEVPGQNKDWYILKVQSNREDSIRDGLLRRVRIHGLDPYFGEVIVPTELVTEFKNGKKKVSKRKLYPGYLMVNMEINEETWFLVRETPGIGDFTGSAGKPSPMLPHEVSKILAKQEEKTDESPKLKIAFNVSDRVKINEGTFANFEGDVDSIDEANGRVTVMINIFGRSTPVELEYWQVEGID